MGVRGDRGRGLEALLRQEGHPTIADSMGRIVDFVDQWWAVPYLSWFTDHGARHSERVAEAALAILDNPDVPKRFQATPLEQYVAWSAAWLHDLGMQALGDERLGELSAGAYNRIRKQHAVRSRDIIRDDAAAMGIPLDIMLVEVIALVAGAHGTESYADQVAHLGRIESVRNEPLRGQLLAATVLIADEMDLDSTRVPILPARPTLNSISAAHARKHELVVASSVRHERGGHLRLSVTFQEAVGIEPEEQHAVELWVTEKLRQQVALVEMEFTEGYNLYSKLSRDVEVKHQPGGRLTALPSEALSVIEADLARFELINHDRCAQAIREQLDALRPVVITGRMLDSTLAQGQFEDFGFIDVDGREDLLRLVLAQRRAETAMVLSSRSLYESGGGATLRDVLEELAVAAGNHTASPSPFDRSRALRDLEERLATREPTVVGVSSIDRLRSTDREWFTQTFVPRLQKQCGVAFVFTADPSGEGSPTAAGAKTISAYGLAPAGVTAYLRRYVPPQVAESEAAAGFRYAKYKELKQHHLVNAALGAGER